jgi:hypothetical protein
MSKLGHVMEFKSTRGRKHFSAQVEIATTTLEQTGQAGDRSRVTIAMNQEDVAGGTGSALWVQKLPQRQRSRAFTLGVGAEGEAAIELRKSLGINAEDAESSEDDDEGVSEPEVLEHRHSWAPGMEKEFKVDALDDGDAMHSALENALLRMPDLSPSPGIADGRGEFSLHASACTTPLHKDGIASLRSNLQKDSKIIEERIERRRASIAAGDQLRVSRTPHAPALDGSLTALAE